jgi:multidrug efflux pump subunit AcrB
VTGIDYIEASSTPSVSNVVIFFKSSKDMEVAFNEVQSKVNTVLNQLPRDIGHSNRAQDRVWRLPDHVGGAVG